jgi:hypothetical protein
MNIAIVLEPSYAQSLFMKKTDNNRINLDKPQTPEISFGAVSQDKQGEKISYLALATLVTSILVIPFLFISLYRLATEPGLDVFSPRMRNVYVFLDNLCIILPPIPIILGIAALIRIAFSRKNLRGRTLAITGIAVAVISLVIYWHSIFSLMFRNMW